jgi:hypothetical protein
LALHNQRVEVQFPSSIAADVERLFPATMMTPAPAESCVRIHEHGSRYSLHADDSPSALDLPLSKILVLLMEEVTKALIIRFDAGVVLHAAAVGHKGISILMPGVTGSGKSSLAAWLVANGFHYLTDEIAILTDAGTIVGFPRALVIKPGAAESVQTFPGFDESKSIECDSHLLRLPTDAKIETGARTVGLLVIPSYQPGTEARIESLPPGETALRLVACNLNAKNLKRGGFESITALSRQVPAVLFHFGGFGQLKGTLDTIVKLAVESRFTVPEMRQFVAAFAATREPISVPVKTYPVPAATPRKRADVKLTVGMPAYDDYDGVYFTLQALRLYHPKVLGDVEFLVIDNHPDGPCSEPLKKLESSIPNYRYVPENASYGTAVGKEHVFTEAGGKFVLCLDSHVFVVPGALSRLLRYLDAHSRTRDLLQGPLLYDDLTTISTHLHPAWRGGMFGIWALDERGTDPDAEPFEIPMQGLGLFACRKAAWPGFNSDFRGFGGEEGYIHEKFRQRGAKILCLPFLRWMHRFNRPMGPAYTNTWEDRIRNYAIGWQELGLPTDQMESHFVSLLGADTAGRIFRSLTVARGYVATESAPSLNSISTVCSISRGKSARASG